ncbi:MAG: cysteine hydrolase [Pirellulales bacterium]|nr:cysteine hydrolase [Pirellulales bacterium]
MKAAETAVVLIEFQNDFCREKGALYELVKNELARQGTIANAVRLAEESRKKGCLLIFCPFVYDAAWVDEKCVCGLIGGAAESGALHPGGWGVKWIDEIQPAEGEPVLEGKHALSGFTNTQLEQILEEHNIRNVVTAGFLSNVCVEATSRSAYDRGYNVRVIRDATAATSQANQEYVEREIYPILGGSMTVDEFIAELE